MQAWIFHTRQGKFGKPQSAKNENNVYNRCVKPDKHGQLGSGLVCSASGA